MSILAESAREVDPELYLLRTIVALNDLINCGAYPQQRAGLESTRDGLRRLALPAGEIELEPAPAPVRPFPVVRGDITAWATIASNWQLPDGRELEGEAF